MRSAVVVVALLFPVLAEAMNMKFLYDHFLPDVARDFSGGKYYRDIPERVKVFLYKEKTKHVPRFAQYNTRNGSFTVRTDDASSLYSLMLEPKAPPADLPDPDVVFDELFKRDVFKEGSHGANFLLMTFVNWFLEDVLKTQPGSGGRRLLSPGGGLALSMVYGRTAERRALLRVPGSCKLRTSVNDKGEVVPLMWKDVATPTPFDSSTVFGYGYQRGEYVLGEDFLNIHWGHIFWVTLYTREHNSLCDMLQDALPGHDVDDLHERARTSLVLLTRRIIVEDYIGGVVATSTKNVVRWEFDHMQCPKLPSTFAPVYLEFNDLYKWHNMIPDDLVYGGQEVSMNSTIFNSTGFGRYALQEHFEGFYRTPTGEFTANNQPEFFRRATVGTLRNARDIGVRGFNDYWEKHGNQRMASFSELTDDDNVVRKLERLYRSIDDLDLHVGLNIQRVTSVSIVPELMLYMVAEHAFSYLYSVDVCRYPERLTDTYLTKKGKEYVYSSESALNSLFARHFDLKGFDNTLFTYEESMSPHVCELCTADDLAIDNLLDYVGMNELWDVVVHIDEFHGGYFSFVVTGAGYVLIIATAMSWVYYKLRTYMEDSDLSVKERDVPLLMYYLLTCAMYALQLPLYTVVALYLLFSCRFDETSVSYILPLQFLVSTHAYLYVTDIYVRHTSGNTNKMLVVHHVVWSAVLFSAAYFRDIFSLKVAVILDYFSLYEFGLFFLLFFSKLHSRNLTRSVVYFGRFAVGLFAVTRVLQFALLGYFFAESYSRMRTYDHVGVWVFQLLASTLLFVAQTYTLHEYSKWKPLWRSTKNIMQLPYGLKAQMGGDSPIPSPVPSSPIPEMDRV